MQIVHHRPYTRTDTKRATTARPERSKGKGPVQKRPVCLTATRLPGHGGRCSNSHPPFVGAGVAPAQATAYRYRGRGGGAEWQPGLLRLSHPPTHAHQTAFLRRQMKSIRGARTRRSMLGRQLLLVASDAPPPARYRSRSPFSRGLPPLPRQRIGPVPSGPERTRSRYSL